MSPGITLNYKNTVATVDQMLSETAVLAAERIEQELTAYKTGGSPTPHTGGNIPPAPRK